MPRLLQEICPLRNNQTMQGSKIVSPSNYEAIRSIEADMKQYSTYIER